MYLLYHPAMIELTSCSASATWQKIWTSEKSLTKDLNFWNILTQILNFWKVLNCWNFSEIRTFLKFQINRSDVRFVFRCSELFENLRFFVKLLMCACGWLWVGHKWCILMCQRPWVHTWRLQLSSKFCDSRKSGIAVGAATDSHIAGHCWDVHAYDDVGHSIVWHREGQLWGRLSRPVLPGLLRVMGSKGISANRLSGH